jgi:hypothetical protein
MFAWCTLLFNMVPAVRPGLVCVHETGTRIYTRLLTLDKGTTFVSNVSEHSGVETTPMMVFAVYEAVLLHGIDERHRGNSLTP